jgi:hypothetical protein
VESVGVSLAVVFADVFEAVFAEKIVHYLALHGVGLFFGPDV